MNHYGVKFALDFENYDYSKIKNIFNKLRSALNWQFDENLNVILIDEDIDYQVRDVSNLEMDEIDKIIDSFFRFNFEDIVNVPLYKFLVLKNNNQLKILANISSLIFDYSSINDFYELFDDLNKSYPKKDLETYYRDVNDYLNSPNFKKDSKYWTKYISDSSNYVNFYNLKDNAYKSRKISVDKDSVSAFLGSHNCSLFDFYGSVFSLYLSRINRIGGSLLKTIVPSEKRDNGVFDKSTLLKIDVNPDDSFNELLIEFDSALKISLNHATVDVENYLDENVSYYSIYDFNCFNEDIHVFTGEDSALTLNIYEDSLELVYNCDLFSDTYVGHMAKNIESLINNVLSSPNQAAGNVDILSNEEKALICEYCKGKTIGVEDKIFSEAFRENAMANPDAIAVDDGINKITYGELEKSSNSVAKDLYENHDISPGSHVALMLHRDYHYPEFILALNKIGAAYIPIDLLFPANRIEHMLNIGEAKNLITTKDIGQNIDLDVNVIYIEDLKYDDDAEVEILGESDDLFAIIFTSGTTGLPKGVMFHNRQFPWGGAAFEDMFNFSHGDAVGSYFSFSFVAALIISISLYLGGSVRLFNENEQKNSLLLINALKENPMNSLILPPSVGIPIFENEDLQLDYLVLAGAKLNELSKKDRHTKLVNFYGTTEVIFAVSKIYDIKNIKDNRVPIGRPVPNTWAYILDKNGNRMPIGVPGEICISGGMVSGGYYNDCESTSDVFLDNPFSDSTLNEKMYRTGDIGFYNYEGEIEIIGREDNQLSVRGFRIESNEILAIMKSFKEISDIYLDVDNDNLIAYYTTLSDLDINEVKDALKDDLPYYMIPSLFMELEEIPLNINGKIDKSSLRTVISDEDVEISDDILSSVVDAFKEVLNQDVVLIDDDFVSLGGNSLSAMKLQLLLNEKLGVSLSSNELIGLFTPQDIANHIKFNLNIHSTVDEEKYSFDDPCPLSESQLNVYLDESVNDMGTAYNNSFKIDFKDNYSVSEIKDALMKLFETFPVLKARVINDNDVLSFVFDGEPEIIEGSLKDMQSFVKPFEFDKYLSRFLVVDDGASSILCADFHHLIFDGTSLNILLNKLSSILDGEDADFIDKGVLRQVSFEELIGSDYMDDAHNFFEGMLADRDEVYELLPSLNGSEEEFELVDTFDIDIENLNSFLQNHSITYNQFFTSVFAYTLSRFSGSDKVIFNIIENGRGHIDLSESVGMFVKTLPVLMDCKNQDIASYLEYSSKLINSVMKYDMYPFRGLASDYNLNSNILFQYSHNLFSDVINKEDSKYVVDELKHDLNADLSFYIFNNGENRLTIRILYSSRYSKNFIGSFTESYKLILQQITNVETLEEITYITREDIGILDSYNQTQHNFKCNDVLDAFNDNLSKYGDNILVGYEDTSYTHGEGAFIANEVVNKLDNLGILKQDYIALFINRSEWFLLACMGVLSMGGIYVPIDTSYPDERIILMLEDTKSKVVIVDDNSEKRMKDIIVENDLNIDVLNVSNIISGGISTSKHLNMVKVNDNDIACVLYTSGTTGIPKGVLVTRKAINNFVSWYVGETNFTSDDVYGMHCSYVFDMHTHALYSPVIAGGSLYIVPEDIRLDLKNLNDYFVEHGCTHTYMTSQLGKLFAESGMETSIKLLCFGGMKLGELNAPDSIGPFESYGPSENLAISTSIFANKRIHHSSIGRFISNVKGYVLDNELRRVPLGAVGELYLAGNQLTLGYLNRVKENNEAFFDNPFDDEEGYDRIYSTGDMVRVLPDGTLGIVDRRDSQVKIRGNRVELTEVESVIRSMDEIKDVTVHVIDNNGNNELVSYIVLSKSLEEDDIVDYIREYVSKRKPEYMVPSYVVKLDEIPLNINGKVDKRALPDVDFTSLHEDYVAPTTEDEKIIVEAFEKVFNQKIGIYDDFVRLGGDSLTAIRLLSHLEGYNVTAVDILSLHTPYAIAKNIKKTKLDLDIYTLENGCPLNESQLNVYLDIAVNNKDDAYTIPLLMEIPEKYGVNEIFDALNKIIEAHPILSMCISDEFEVPYLVKGSNPSIIVENDVSDDFIVEFINMPFDLQDSLCRFLIINDNDNYKLFGAFNHIIFDGLSTNVFKRDLQAILDGESISVDESFLKVSAFSQQIQNTDEYANAKNFYESMLIDNEESSTLMESIDSNEQGQLKIDLDLDINLLKSFLDKHGASENVLFTGAFAYTLSHFTGYETASFNIVENGRDRFNNFSSIGMFVNTLPLLVDCKNQNVASFIENTAGLIYDVMRYNYYPFRLLVNEYNISSDILFQFLPEWIGNNGKFDNSINDTENKIITQRDNLIADFFVEVTQSGEEYNLNITYCDKYSKDFVERFAESYKLILQQITDVEMLEEITYITQEDIGILDSYNQTEKKLPYEDILDAFNDNLSEYPDNTFVSYNDVSYTFAEGAFIADRIAKCLIELGVNSQDCVGFLLPRSELYALSILGIMSIGAFYVPIDENLPDERAVFMIKDTQSKVLIVSDETYGRGRDLDNDCIILNISDIINSDIGTLDKLNITYGDLVCILYTSGSTGLPKGVKIKRKSVLNFIDFHVNDLNIHKEDVYGLFTSIGFDVAMAAIFSAIYVGCCLNIIPEDIRLNIKALNNHFIKHGVTHTSITTQVAKLFIQEIESTSLKVLVAIGEKLGEISENRHYIIVDAYGPTEACVYVTSATTTNKIDPSSIGYVQNNTKAYILDNEKRRVPIGCVGELYLSGHQLADGYLNREKETKDAFMNNPFEENPDYNKLYRTGDLVRLLPDKTYGIVGRRDNQVKIRGNRVELSEVESAIRELDYVDDVTVQTVKNGDNYELVAYVVLSNEFDGIIEEEIQNHVGEIKPEYMVPSFIIKLDEIPLTINSKVDKHALPGVDLESLHVEYVAPRNEIEWDIVNAFKKVFNQDEIGVYDDFVRLGGDSLTAIKLLNYLKDYNVSVADVLSLRTPYAIADNIKEISFDLDVYSLDSGCPLSESQLNVYLDIVANDKKDAYLIPLFMDISNKYDAEGIVDALNEMFCVHPILGMCVSDSFDVPYLVKGLKPSVSIESDVDDEFIVDFLTRPFDLMESLSRFLIIKNDDNYSLYAVFHHIIFDALSDEVFKKDLQSILDGGIVDIDDSFLKVSAFNQQLQKTEDYLEAEKFFNSMLVDSDDVGVLLDSVLSDGSGHYLFDLDLDYDLFNSFLETYNVSANILFSAVFAYTLSRFVGSDKVLFNIVENGRDRFVNYDSIGMFVNTLPLLVDCKNQDVQSFMEYVSDKVYGVMKYNYYPFRLLANKYDINSDILFQYIPEWIKDTNDVDEIESNNELISNMDDLIADLTVDIIQRGNKHILSITYSEKYSKDFISHFIESYKLILGDILNVNELSEINYISDRDIEILDSYNRTEHDLIYSDILDAFNDNLSKYPNNLLVSSDNISYSYGEGAFIASRIAELLIDLGVESQDCVGFLVPRSELYMFSVLGILSMGGVYVPLEDNHPDERINFILKDSETKVVIVVDETYDRAKSLFDDDDVILLNISNIVNEDVGSLSVFPANYGDLACILYTSGTTGLPKGVKVKRKALLNVSSDYVDKYDLGAADVYALFSSIGFDVSSFVICAVIRSGACLSVIPDDIRLNMSAMNEYFIKQGVTHAFITTQVGKLFVQTVDDTSLKVLLVAGEKLGEFESPEDYLLIDAYGPTEAFAFNTSVDNNVKIDGSSVGMLNYNTSAYVLDNQFRRVPFGAVGELYLAGYQVADGYLNREEENARAFIENPFSNEEGYNTLYRTGDLVRILPDGSLGIVGRSDSQVKIRGNRVELGEVEAVIRQMDNILDVTVQTVKVKDNNELVAYVVSDESDELTIENAIREHVGEVQPDYMIPSFVICLDHIPLTVNGKVNRSALPEVDMDSLSVEYVAPTSKTEEQIVSAYEVVFNQKDIGLNDDFTRLGGDSITAIRLISLLEKDGISCSARDILNYKTPYLIAKNIQTVENISYDAVEGNVDLLPIQEYFFDQINKDNFTQSFILKLKEKIDKNILQESFNELCNIHDMLRANYSFSENGKAIQEILPVGTEICKINEHTILDNFEESLKDIFIKSSDSINKQNKLIEINLINYKSDLYIMFIIHHLIVDGVSWNILISDLTQIYHNLNEEKEIEVTRPYPYKTWVEDVKNLAEDISSNEKEHWIKINSSLDDSAIKGDAKAFAFDVDVNYDVDNLLMLTEEEYWALAIARAYKKTYGKDIIFNRETHGRDESIAKLNRTIGWFTSQYPILVNTNNDYDDISLMNDVYNIKTAFKDVNNLGLNYASLVYTNKEFEFKHCPVTFNFLSSEFTFENELFESIMQDLSLDYNAMNTDKDSESYGATFNISNQGNSYIISGEYANNTYIGCEFDTFVENIKSELEFIGNFNFKNENIICCLSESQLGVYLDEKSNEKGTAYSTPGAFEYDSVHSIDEIKDAIHALINKHPILRGRILDTDGIPLLICDNNPSIETISNANYHDLIKAFDLDKSLSRFYIVDNDKSKFVFYDLHHIISDATTRTLINKDLKQALMGELDDEIDLGFAYASRDSFESKYDPKYKSAHKFFQDMFADIDDVQYFLEDIDGSMGSVSLPIRGIRRKVESFTQKYSITTSNLLNAVFAYTYSRFTGSNKVCYNFTEHGRHEDYLKGALGMFVRTVPILIDCENKTVSDFVTDVSNLILKSMANRNYPFRLLAREFNLTNDVVFEYNYDLNDFDIGNDIVVRKDADSVSEFLCVVNDLDDGFVVSVSHLDRFSQHTAKQFVKVFKEILIQILEKENLADINYISNEDMELLDEYNKTDIGLNYTDILEAFNDNLPKYPDNTLVSYNDVSYTFAEGAFIADRIAKCLIDLGVNAQDCVGFLLPRSELYALSVLGIMSMGAVYVPLDENLPDDRIDFMIKDTQSKVLIVSDGTYGRGYDLDNDCIILNISDIVNCEIEPLYNLDVVYGDLACILYTSGSTGLPKGVKITRKSILNFIDFHISDLDILREDVYGLFASIGFDVAMAAIFSAIYAGCCVNIIPEDIRLNIKALNNHFIKHGVTHTYITTQVAKLFIQEIESTSLKVLVAGGEKLGEITENRHYRIVDAYGPTEACVYVISAATSDKIDSSSVGYVQNNTKAYILDDEKRRVPIGCVGELYLSGCQLADGYLNRDKETKDAFMDNPFEENLEYNKLYRTGDMARLLHDKTYGIVGRRDNQVKIRGNRVELLEIEVVIREIDYVNDVTVQIIENNSNIELVAYVVVSNEMDEEILKNNIQDHVRQQKPEYMVPSYVIKLDSIPLNVNGKVDKHALPDVDRTSLHVEYVAPRNENEKEIVKAFENALNLEKVGIHDDFIRLGGDSLTAIKLLSHIKSNDITMADILTFRTPEAIAKNMSDFSFDLDLYTIESGCPLNAAQLNVFADVTIYNKRNAYHIPGYIPISKEHSLEDIQSALDEMLKAHPILGMHLIDMYEENNSDDIGNLDIIRDLITTAKKFGIKEILSLINAYGLKDLGGIYNMIKTTIRLFKGEYPYMIKGEKPQISVESEFDTDTIIEFLAESLDIYNNLSKFMIVETEESYYLVYVIHHLIFDAVSAGVFKHDFEILLDGGSVKLDDTFLKASAYTQQIKNTDKFKEASEYYHPILSALDDAGTLSEDNSSEGYSTAAWDLKFDKTAFKSFLNKAGISENVLFTSVFAYAMSQFVDEDKVIFTLIENGRDRFNENFIGMTSNVMPLVADCKDQSISSFMKNMADAVYGISRHSYYPILLLYQKYNFEVNTLFQFIPNWIADDFNVEDIDDIDTEEIMNFILDSYGDYITEFFVQIYQNGENYRLLITNSNKFSNKLIEDFKDTYISILLNIINTDLDSNLNATLK